LQRCRAAEQACRADPVPRPCADRTTDFGTQVFTHLLLAEVVAKDAVRYDTQIGQLLPKSVQPRNPGVARITLERLATHHSGLPRQTANLKPNNTLDPRPWRPILTIRPG